MEEIDKSPSEFNSEPPPGADPDHGVPAPPYMLAAALKLAEQGFRVLPLHTPTGDGACSCRGTDCERVGKHPRTAHGVKDASHDPAQIEAWWAQWPDANIGIATGGDLRVLDVDPRKGGDKTLEQLLLEHGPLPTTIAVASGGDGQHYYFTADPDGNRTTEAGAGLDVLGEGSYVIAPPSLHRSGKRYRWTAQPGDVERAQAPEWLARPIRRREATDNSAIGSDDDGSAVRPKLVDRLLATLSGKLKKLVQQETGSAGDRSKHSFNVMLMLMELGWSDRMIRALAEGQPFGSKWQGQRDDLREEIQRVRGKWRGSGAKLAEGSSAQRLAQLFESYHVVLVGGHCLIAHWRQAVDQEVLDLIKLPDFRSFYSPHKLLELKKDKLKWSPIAQVFLEKAPRYEALTFAPPPLKCPPGQLNLWRGYGVEARQGVCGLTKKHILEVLANGDAEVANYIIKCMAWSVQNPGRPAEVALVFRGGRGSGKGIFARSLMKLFGPQGKQIHSAKHLVGDFNMHLVNCSLLYVDEAFWAGDKRGESVLKGLITEPTITIEPKGVNVFQVPNCLHIIMTSNKDWVVPAGEDERRFAVFEVSDRYAYGRCSEEERKKYFDALTAEIDHGGLEAMLYDLQRMDLQGWHPRWGIPKTNALLEQKLATADWLDKKIIDIAEEGRLPCVVQGHPSIARTSFDKAHDQPGLYDVLKIGAPPEAKHMSAHALAKQLRVRYGCMGYHSSNIRGFCFPPLRDLRTKIETRFGAEPGQMDWDEPWEWEGQYGPQQPLQAGILPFKPKDNS